MHGLLCLQLLQATTEKKIGAGFDRSGVLSASQPTASKRGRETSYLVDYMDLRVGYNMVVYPSTNILVMLLLDTVVWMSGKCLALKNLQSSHSSF